MAPNGSGISRQPHEVIEIDSDSDNEVVEVPRPAPGPPVACLPPQPLQPAFPRRPWDEELATAAPEAEQRQEAPDHGRRNHRPAPAEPQPHAAHPMTADECLAKVLDIYPDISHEHVRGIFRDDLDVGIQPDSTWCEQLIVRILDEGAYPTEREARRAALKRKREPSEHEFDQNPMESATPVVRRAYQSAAMILLQNEYPEIPVKFIDQTLREQRSFYNAFLLLEATERTYYATDIVRRLYKKVRSRDPKSLDNHYALAHEGAHVEAMEKVRREVAAAKKKVGQDTAKREDAQRKALEEEHNKAIAVSSNAMMECLCCFDKFPTNRMTFCNGEQAHFYCHGCATSWVNSQLGDGKCWPKCLGQDGCEAEILQSELKAFLDPQTYGRLERMQQQDSLRNAGLSDLVYCPFCDFAAQCEPIEINREFHCQNSDCGVLSCRLCRAESHTPKTCEEAVKDRKGNARHQVEEAMTEALLRTCNKCKARFLKSEGCNKMTCPTCYNTQCYVCSKTVHGYDHFHESAGKCPLYDNNTEKRHQEEVKAAEAAALFNKKNKGG
ncbi:Zinc finger C6HC-type protein [Macrophomina phaseolina MS6]|uniref:Zinc finger C6HC-type protein n=1 Tax=Macrophomina phaseolina (strain MS6) TaxID=1126212 RepID=K2S3D4_MACPH|nr:Zinc finger C6HC-type protein [Macrophomina phaseolina MS6]